MPSVYKSETIKNNPLEKVPDFYKSAGGNPYYTRVRKGDSKQGYLKIEKKITFSGDTTYSGGTTSYTQTINHKLGKYTYPIGQLELGEDYFPIPFAGWTGFDVVITYSSITKDSLTLKISSNVPTQSLSVKAVVYLLRETL